jgi:hypothetical protein
VRGQSVAQPPGQAPSRAAQVSFSFNKGLLDSYGLAVDPEVVQRIPGAPEYGSVEVTFTLKGGRANLPSAPVDLLMPLNIKNGPPVLLSLRYLITTPDVKLSTDSIDFDAVQTGNCKVSPWVGGVQPAALPCAPKALQARGRLLCASTNAADCQHQDVPCMP